MSFFDGENARSICVPSTCWGHFFECQINEILQVVILGATKDSREADNWNQNSITID